ncbi:MAG: hypothetical protein D6698_05575 [Gammaproteobacteria bacterium]|nr:MAG: hypothetical protein D6698_05575 [Gammaproteobacteria bacterium]
MNSRIPALFWPFLLWLLFFSLPSQAYVGLCCAKCGGNMPMNIPGGGIPETKEFRLKVSPMFMNMDGLKSGNREIDGNSLLGMPSMGKFMATQTSMDMKMMNLSLGYSFSDRIVGMLMLMYRDNAMDMRFNAMMKNMTGRSGFTMKSSGLADTMLMGKFRLFANDPQFPTRQGSLFLGVTLPTGSIDEKNTRHPLAMRQTEQLPYGMQLGSGTFDPSIGFLYQASRSPYWWGINTTYTARLYDNKRNYRLGNRVNLDAYGMYQFRHDMLAHLQLNGKYRGHIRGEMDESVTGASGHAIKNNGNSPFMTPLWDPQNYGGTQWYVSTGLQWQPASLQILDLTATLPVYQNLNGPQLKDSWRLMLTWYKEIPTKASIRYFKHKSGHSKLGF